MNFSFKNKSKNISILLSLSIFILFLSNIFFGSVSIPIQETWNILMGKADADSPWRYIIIESIHFRYHLWSQSWSSYRNDVHGWYGHCWHLDHRRLYGNHIISFHREHFHYGTIIAVFQHIEEQSTFVDYRHYAWLYYYISH